MRRLALTRRRLLLVLLLLVAALGVEEVVRPDLVPVSALTIPVILGAFRLRVSGYLVLSVAVAVVLGIELATLPSGESYLAAVVVAVVMAVGFRHVAQRDEWGIGASKGMPILLDVRDRVRSLGEPPSLAGGWSMARALRSARNSAFRGDFTLAGTDGPLVHAMVVDVSGHGLDVASRAMQVAGAFGGLLDVIAPGDLLTACNDYLCRREWARDYATAVHVVLDRTTGRAQVRSAGHPPAQVRRADGTWTSVQTRGPVLGLTREATFRPVEVDVAPGDTLVLASDGALDDDADDPWGSVRAVVDDWLGRGAVPGSHDLTPTMRGGDDDQTIVGLHRR